LDLHPPTDRIDQVRGVPHDACNRIQGGHEVGEIVDAKARSFNPLAELGALVPSSVMGLLVEPAPERLTRRDGEQKAAAGRDQATRLFQDSPIVIEVFEDVEHRDQIERCCEWRIVDRSAHQRQRAAAARKFQPFRKRIHAHDHAGIRTRRLEHPERIPRAAANLEHVIAARELGRDALDDGPQRKVTGDEPEVAVLDVEQS
jgi:hypothetical protein